MNTNNPFTPPIEAIHLTDRGGIEEQRVTAVNIANNTRFALYPFVRDLLAKVEQLGQPEQPAVAPVSSPQVVPESLKVVGMMEQDMQRKLTEQEKLEADAILAVEQAFMPITNVEPDSHNYELPA